MTVEKTPGDIANRIGVWVSMLAIGLYVINIGAWVGAADEKFASAKTVEEKQDKLIVDVATIQTTQGTQTKAIEDNKKAIEESRKEILAAIKELEQD